MPVLRKQKKKQPKTKTKKEEKKTCIWKNMIFKINILISVLNKLVGT